MTAPQPSPGPGRRAATRRASGPKEPRSLDRGAVAGGVTLLLALGAAGVHRGRRRHRPGGVHVGEHRAGRPRGDRVPARRLHHPGPTPRCSAFPRRCPTRTGRARSATPPTATWRRPTASRPPAVSSTPSRPPAPAPPPLRSRPMEPSPQVARPGRSTRATTASPSACRSAERPAACGGSPAPARGWTTSPSLCSPTSTPVRRSWTSPCTAPTAPPTTPPPAGSPCRPGRPCRCRWSRWRPRPRRSRSG